MTERERLTVLIEECTAIHESGFDPDKRISAEALARYLLANGVILPPCKVGDEVYRIVKRCGEWQILPCIVKGITYRGGEWWDIVVAGPDGMLGSTVFLTRKEAEAELERRRKEVNTT